MKRQSGFLKPEINKSNGIGSSFTQPYFKAISKQRFYFSPTWFDNKFYHCKMNLGNQIETLNF